LTEAQAVAKLCRTCSDSTLSNTKGQCRNECLKKKGYEWLNNECFPPCPKDSVRDQTTTKCLPPCQKNSTRNKTTNACECNFMYWMNSKGVCVKYTLETAGAVFATGTKTKAGMIADLGVAIRLYGTTYPVAARLLSHAGSAEGAELSGDEKKFVGDKVNKSKAWAVYEKNYKSKIISLNSKPETETRFGIKLDPGIVFKADADKDLFNGINRANLYVRKIDGSMVVFLRDTYDFDRVSDSRHPLNVVGKMWQDNGVVVKFPIDVQIASYPLSAKKK